jgi:hypothetical protein
LQRLQLLLQRGLVLLQRRHCVEGGRCLQLLLQRLQLLLATV